MPTRKNIVLRKTFNDCYECVSHSRNTGGYTEITLHYKQILLTRFIYTAIHGPIPEGLVLRHTCDNRACCNPTHLVLGTTQDNSDDMVARGRAACGERHGMSTLTAEQIIAVKKLQNSGLTQQEAGDICGIPRRSVSDIWRGRTWSSVVLNESSEKHDN